ncbi:MAG: hypothetical protein V1257_12765, partial [Candidatus Neomarinimicrobiota bacterium]|nr:hypothetical protein [Candidatus Neomarinimicrobiota bacterium]
MIEQDSELKTVKKIIENNLSDLQERIDSACSRSMYKQESVELVISTKYVDADIIRILSELGISCIGENRLQDTERKREELYDLDLKW